MGRGGQVGTLVIGDGTVRAREQAAPRVPPAGPTLPGGVLYIICGSGSRSAAASTFLVENGHTCVHNVLGGMGAWRSAGYPTVTP